MSILENPVCTEIIESYEKGDWESVLNLQHKLDSGVLLWPKPHKTDLDFIASTVQQLGLNGIISVGCGTGLLEWLLHSTNNLKMTGLEIDRGYWSSRYARKSFIPLVFPQDADFRQTLSDPSKALMFSYFNDNTAFQWYLRVYQGSSLIIIGPYGNQRFTKPAPLDEDIPLEWQLWSVREIFATGDFIAIYRKY